MLTLMPTQLTADLEQGKSRACRTRPCSSSVQHRNQKPSHNAGKEGVLNKSKSEEGTETAKKAKKNPRNTRQNKNKHETKKRSKRPQKQQSKLRENTTNKLTGYLSVFTNNNERKKELLARK